MVFDHGLDFDGELMRQTTDNGNVVSDGVEGTPQLQCHAHSDAELLTGGAVAGDGTTPTTRLKMVHPHCVRDCTG